MDYNGNWEELPAATLDDNAEIEVIGYSPKKYIYNNIL
jgi:hypothetical protein